MCPNVIAPESLDTFIGPSSLYMKEAAMKKAYKSIIFTDVLYGGHWKQSPLFHLPSDVERLEFTTYGALAKPDRLVFYQDLKTLRIWAADDASLQSALVDIMNMPGLEVLEIGWVGAEHRSDGVLGAADRAIASALRSLPNLRELTVYAGPTAPYLRVDALHPHLANCPRLERLMFSGVIFEDGQEPLRMPPTLRALCIHDTDLPRLDLAPAKRLEFVSLERSLVGRVPLDGAHRLEQLILEGEILEPHTAHRVSDAVLLHYGVRLPPHFRRQPAGGARSRRASA